MSNLKTKGIILFMVGAILFSCPADARRLRDDIDLKQTPDNIQQLRQALEKVVELVPRIRFDPELINSSQELYFILQKMRELKLSPEFILNVHQIIEEVEAVASSKLSIAIKTDLILIRPKGCNAGADLVTRNEGVEMAWLGIDDRRFGNKEYLSVIELDLDGLFELYELTSGNYADVLTTVIAHELGHNLSELSARTNNDLIRLIQEGFNSRYAGVIQFDFSSYSVYFDNGYLSVEKLEDVIGRLHEIIADKIASQLTNISSMIAREEMEEAKREIVHDVLVPNGIDIIYDAWRVAKVRFLGLNDEATMIESNFEKLAMESGQSEQIKLFRKLVFDFESCYRNWGLNVP
ncbi:MAG: hypothetical protein P9X27_04950 [Candidatus Kaelpia aquatica]|nr:hypothetical protein [Candidatus Kaelpia aquatica]